MNNRLFLFTSQQRYFFNSCIFCLLTIMGIKSKQSFCRFETNIKSFSLTHIFCWDWFLNKKGEFFCGALTKNISFKKKYILSSERFSCQKEVLYDKRPLVYFLLQNPFFLKFSSPQLNMGFRVVFFSRQ